MLSNYRPRGSALAGFFLLLAGLLSPLSSPLSQASDPSLKSLNETLFRSGGREETVSVVPMAVTVLTAEDLRRRQIRQLWDLQYWTPGLSILAGAGYSIGNRFFVRGLGQSDAQITLDPAVRIYLDGVELGRETIDRLDMSDIDRVEILRGPQDEFYGVNASGAIINLFSQPPSEGENLSITPTITDRGGVNLRLVGNHPLSERAAARVSLTATKTERLFHVDGVDQDVGKWESVLGRLTLSRQTPKGFSFSLGAYMLADRSDAPPANLPTPEDLDGDLYTIDANPATVDCEERDKGFACFDDYDGRIQDRGATFSMKGAEGLHQVRASVGWRHVESSHTAIFERDSWGERENDAKRYGGRVFLSSKYGGRFNWLAGISHQRESSALDYSFVETTKTYALQSKAYSAFGRALFDWHPLLNLHLGIRHGWEEKSLENAEIDTSATRSHNTDYTSYRAAIRSHLVKNPGGFFSSLMAYASQAKGYKSLGWSTECRESGNHCFAEVIEERAITSELGLRSSWFGGRASVNLTAFTTDYKDPQVDIVANEAQSLTNLHRATIEGVELEFDVRILDNLQIYGNLSQQKGSYDSLATDPDEASDIAEWLAAGSSCSPVERDCLLDLEPVAIPKTSAALGVHYGQNIGPFMLDLDVTLTRNGKLYMQASNAPHSVRDSYSEINAQLRFSPLQGAWEVSLWAMNLTDETVSGASFGNDLDSDNPQSIIYPVGFRTIGVSFSYRFGAAPASSPVASAR